MQFGIGPIGCRRPPGDQTSFSDIYESEVALAEAAAANGYDSAWVAEHHFASDGYIPSPFTVAGAVAARTPGIEIGIGIAIAPFYEPLRLAEDAVAVDHLAAARGGNCTVGLGIGYRDLEFKGFGIPKAERVPRLLDTIDVCRGAWRDEPMSFDGRVFSYPEVNVTPKPTQGIKLLVGAVAEDGIRRAARRGDGWIAPPGWPRDRLTTKLEILQEALREVDRDPSDFDVYLMQYLFVHEDGAEAAWETIREPYTYVRKKYLEYFSASTDSDLDLTPAEIEDKVDDFVDTWRSHVILGTPAAVTSELEAYADAWPGELHMILDSHYPGMAFETAEESVGLFGREVLPQLQDA